MNNLILAFLGFIVIYLLVIWKAGKTYPILYLFLFTYFLQYIFSSYLMYTEYRELDIKMGVNQNAYFEYAIPAMFFLFLGVFLFSKDYQLRDVLKKIDSRQANKVGYLLLIISYSFDLLPFFGITSLGSIISFTQYLKYVAVFCFLFTNSWINYALGVLVYVQLAIIVLRGGVFIDFINWTTYLFFFIALKFRLSFLLRTSFILVALPVLILIQSVKDDYRKVTWVKDRREAGIDLFTELAQKKGTEEQDLPFSKKEGVVQTVSRLNEGWHLGLTLSHVPQKEPIANGKEMLSDVISSILPRVLFADKKIAISKEKFYKYTGHKLYGSTSMTIGLLGDFYINFGRGGSFIMLFFFGAIIARLLHYFIHRFVLEDPINLVWVPFMLSYLIRADDDFYIVLNCLAKGFVIFIGINYIRFNFFNAKKPRRVIVKSLPS